MIRIAARRAAFALGVACLLGLLGLLVAQQGCSTWVPFSCRGPDPELVDAMR